MEMHLEIPPDNIPWVSLPIDDCLAARDDAELKGGLTVGGVQASTSCLLSVACRLKLRDRNDHKLSLSNVKLPL